jgi:lysine 2,3-aminomutase
MPDGSRNDRITLRDADALIRAGLVATALRDAVTAVERRYAVAITPAMQALIRDPNDPIGRQFIPDAAELVTAPHERSDPIADDALSPIKGVVHRYPDRALLKPLLICPVYCRFCFRREHVGPDGGLLTEAELQAAYEWFSARPAIREVILTGGDPFMLSARRLASIVQSLAAIPHVEILRIHTRVPVADPDRVTEALAEALNTPKSMWVVLHANHAREITADAQSAIRRLQQRAVPLLGQSVLLRGVNDSVEALEALFRAMLAARVKPYYTICTSSILPPAPRGSRCRSRRAAGCWRNCAAASPDWHGRPMCWIYLAATGRCRSGRTIWRRTACETPRGICGCVVTPPAVRCHRIRRRRRSPPPPARR